MEDKFATYDAAYVLGALSPADRRAFEEHLATCPACAESVAELAGMPGLLARVPISEALDETPEEPMPATLLPSLFDEVARKRRQRRWYAGGAILAAAAALIVLLVMTIVPGTTTGSGTRVEAGAKMSAVIPVPIHATASIQNVGWGSKITVHCGYDPGNYGARKYALTVTPKDTSKPDQVATWMIQPGKDATVQGSSSLHSADIASIAITSESGKPLLRLNP
jgi:hypothetical protein